MNERDARSTLVLIPDEVGLLRSNAPEGTPLEVLLRLVHRGEGPGADNLPGAGGHASPDPRPDPRRSLLSPTGRSDRGAIGHYAETKRPDPTSAPEANPQAFTRDGDTAVEQTHRHVAEVLASSY